LGPLGSLEEEQKLYDFGFHALRPREFVSLVLAGEWRNAAPGEAALAEGEPVTAVAIPISGSLEVRREGQRIGSLGPGNLVGTALALTGEASQIEARFVEAARYIRWPLQNLRAFADRRPELRLALQRFVNRDLARKVEGLAAAPQPPAAGESG